MSEGQPALTPEQKEVIGAFLELAPAEIVAALVKDPSVALDVQRAFESLLPTDHNVERVREPADGRSGSPKGRASSCGFSDQLDAIVGEFAGPINPEPWFRSIGVDPYDAVPKFAEYAADMHRAMLGEPRAYAPADYAMHGLELGFQIGVEWGRRYSPERV